MIFFQLQKTKQNALVRLGCYNRISQAKWFTQHKFIFPQFWGLEVPGQVQLGLFQVRALFLACRRLPVHCAFTWPFPRVRGKREFPLPLPISTPVPPDEDPTQMTSLNPNYFLKLITSSIFKCNHTGVRASVYKSGRTPFSSQHKMK